MVNAEHKSGDLSLMSDSSSPLTSTGNTPDSCDALDSSESSAVDKRTVKDAKTKKTGTCPQMNLHVLICSFICTRWKTVLFGYLLGLMFSFGYLFFKRFDVMLTILDFAYIIHYPRKISFYVQTSKVFLSFIFYSNYSVSLFVNIIIEYVVPQSKNIFW